MNSYGHMNRLIDRTAYTNYPNGQNIIGTIIGIWSGSDGNPQVVLEVIPDHSVVRLPLDWIKLFPLDQRIPLERFFDDVSGERQTAGRA